MIYERHMTLGEARTLYFERNGFGPDGGYDEFWIKVKVWRFPIWLPNTKGRVRAVKLHDLHHVLTEYPTTWRGEAEISAWEIGSGGLRHFWAGWWLDLMNVAQGLVVNPRGVYRAFMRGRRTANLYGGEFDDAMLTEKVGDYRRKLRLDEADSDRRNWNDLSAYVGWVGTGVLTYVVSVVIPLVAVTGTIGYAVFWR